MEKKRKKIVVIGLGNVLLRDDGVGVYVIEQLRRRSVPKNVDVQFIDGGLTPDLSVFLDDVVSKLIIIDAAETGGAPGNIRTVNPLDIRLETSSIHGIDLQQNLELMRLAGTLPEEVVILGVEPQDMSPGTELTPALKAVVPDLLEHIRILIES